MNTRWILVILTAALTLAAGCNKSTPPADKPDKAPTASQAKTDNEPPPAGEAKAPPKNEPVAESPKGADTRPSVERNAVREEMLSLILIKLLNEQHLRTRALDDDMSKLAFDAFIERLDPGKLFLLKKDADALKRHTTKIDDQLKSGKLDLAMEGGVLLMTRIRTVEKLVTDVLSKPFDLTVEDTLETDGEKRDFCVDDAALHLRWERVLKYQLLSRTEQLKRADEDLKKEGTRLTDDRDPAIRAREKLDARYKSRFKRMLQTDHIDWLERYINAVAEVWDPHTSWMPPRRTEDFDIRMSGRLEGIGAVLREDGPLIQVVRIVPGSASWRQGQLEADDHILAVAEGSADAVDVVDMRLRDAVRLIRGKKDTEVRLTVKKKDGRSIVVPIVRDVVKIETAYAKGAMLKLTGVAASIGYIDIPSFYGTRNRKKGDARTSSGDVRRVLETFREKHGAEMKGVILDLRGNGGGFLLDAQAMAGLFFDEGPVVLTKGRGPDSRTLRDPKPDVVYDGPLIVLVDRYSASASEIVAAALQDYGRAVVVGSGKHTHGKGTVQTLVNMDRFIPENVDADSVAPLGVLKLTERSYYRISGGSTQLRGVTPDVRLPDPNAYVESGEGRHKNAIPWDEVAPVPHNKWARKLPSGAALTSASTARQATVEAFKRVAARNTLLEARKDASIWPISQKSWDARRTKEEKELDELELWPDDAPALFETTLVRYGDGMTAEKDGKDPAVEWSKEIAKDPWLEETLRVMNDMLKTSPE